MRLINVKAFLERESSIREGKRVDRRAKVLDFGDDEATEYAILSHRWVGHEVDYEEVVELAKMAAEERDEIRQRDGYQKIIQSCEQAQKDGYEWLWVDTCCIDKRRMLPPQCGCGSRSVWTKILGVWRTRTRWATDMILLRATSFWGPWTLPIANIVGHLGRWGTTS